RQWVFFLMVCCLFSFFFFQAEDGIRDFHVTGVQTCALPISTIDERVEVCKTHLIKWVLHTSTRSSIVGPSSRSPVSKKCLISRNIQGYPMDARPIIMPSTSYSIRQAAAFSTESTSPFPKIGI